MSQEDISLKKRRILRFIRDLDLRYIRGSIDRRTYQTLKNKYQDILENLPVPLKRQTKVEAPKTPESVLPNLESDIQMIQKGEEQKITAPPPKKVLNLPQIELEDIPQLEIEELKIRYVMNMAIKAATRSFEDEMRIEQEYVADKMNDQEYLTEKNAIEAKQHKIFQHFYKLSELLFTVCKDHVYKNTHNNFLLFNNELSENINRLRRMETDKKELKGIIYDINERVLRHRPIIRKAAQDSLRWKVEVQKEKERFLLFKNTNQQHISDNQKEELDRKIKQLEIYEELLDEDINDYAKDLDAMDEIYGEHLKYQEIITPYFKDLTLEIEERIQRFSEIASSQKYKQKIAITSKYSPKEMNYQLIAELRSFWRYSGRPVVDEQDDLVGFLIGPGQLNEQYGIVIRQQQEISLSMVRRIYDHILTSETNRESISEDEKREELLNEILKKLPQVPFSYLIPEIIFEYSKRANMALSEELIEVMSQPENYLFIPIEYVIKSSRQIQVKNESIVQNGNLIPYFNPNEANMITDHVTSNKNIEVKNIFGQKLGVANSVIYHPSKGYFLVVERKKPNLRFYEKIYDILYSQELTPIPQLDTSSLIQKKNKVLGSIMNEFDLTKNEVENTKFLKRMLIRKCSGLLPTEVENSKYLLVSLGNVKIISDILLVNYGAPYFQLAEIFNLEGKVVENVKGTEIGVVYNLKLKEKPLISLWTSIDLLLIASFIDENPEKLFEKDESFVDNLAISIGKQLSIAPQVALRPDIVMTFMNLIGKVKSIDHMNNMIEKFNLKTIELKRIISVDRQRILADISDKEIMDEIKSDIEIGEIDDDHRYVTSPDYYLKKQ